jgi:hypothetical protein
MGTVSACLLHVHQYGNTFLIADLSYDARCLHFFLEKIQQFQSLMIVIDIISSSPSVEMAAATALPFSSHSTGKTIPLIVVRFLLPFHFPPPPLPEVEKEVYC